MQEMWVQPLGQESSEGGHGNPLQYSCLENPTDWGAWQATVQGAAKGQTWLKGPGNMHDHTLETKAELALSSVIGTRRQDARKNTGSVWPGLGIFSDSKSCVLSTFQGPLRPQALGCGSGRWGFSAPLPAACCSLPPTSLAASKASCGDYRRGHRSCQGAVEHGSPLVWGSPSCSKLWVSPGVEQNLGSLGFL